MRIVVDENLPRPFASILAALGHDACHVVDLGLAGLDDVDWLPQVKARADIVFSTDANMARRGSEVAALRAASLRLFVFPAGGDLAHWVHVFLARRADIERALLLPNTAFRVRMGSVQKLGK